MNNPKFSSVVVLFGGHRENATHCLMGWVRSLLASNAACDVMGGIRDRVYMIHRDLPLQKDGTR